MCDSIILPKIIGNFEWSEVRQLLERNYDLSIDETEKLFCVKYNHDSRLWTRGTEQQKLILTQNDKPMLFHSGTRNMSNLQELQIDIGILEPRSFQFDNFDQCLKYVNQMN